MISYAQNFEDVILWRALKHIGKGSYIDIGAQDPVVHSVSLTFYEQGWRGVHVEPTPSYAGALRAARPDETVIEAAVGANGAPILFWEFPDTGLSTGDPAIAARHVGDNRACVQREVPSKPLSAILDSRGGQPIHWLKIDVEGMEDQVIESWSPSSARPWIVLVESTKPNSQEPSYAAWEPKLVTLGYEFVYFDGLSRFYVSKERSELKAAFGSGANLFDFFQLPEASDFVRDLVARKAGEIEQLSRKLEAAKSAREHDREQAIRRESELELANAWLAAMRSSASWRLSAPLRWLGSLVRRGLRRVPSARQAA